MNNTLIVGGSSSIGLKISQNFLDIGDTVFATYHNNPIKIAHDRLHSIHLNLVDDKSFVGTLAEILPNHGTIKKAIFLSGILPGNDLPQYDEDLIDKVMTVNFSNQAKLIKLLLPYFSDDSQIIMMASISGEKGSFDPIYAASKGAIIAFVKSLSQQLPPKIRVNAIAPSLIKDSKMYHDMDESRQDFHRKSSPMDNFILADDLAKIIVDLTMPHWRMLNGSIIRLNGGIYV